MHKLLHSRIFYIVIAAILIILGVIAIVRVVTDDDGDRIVTTVTLGTIENIVSVSGIVDARSAADLAFPQGGIVSAVRVSEGDEVSEGQELILLEQRALEAERQDAVAALLIAQADRDELIAGPRTEARDVTKTSVEIAKEDLARTIAEEADKVEHARRTLLSTGLEVLPVRKDNNDVPPTVSGTYACVNEGEYRLSVYHSNAYSGYSYRLSGLESGTYTAYTESPAPLGNCGLSIQFDEGEVYGNADWILSVPNTRSSSYTSNLNAYQLALRQQENNVSAKEQALNLALSEQTLENASPRDEELKRANARVIQAESRLNAAEANLADRTLTAPFAGIVDSLDVIAGETVTTLPVVTIVANDTFELIARIPEIDIAKMAVGQRANVVFDARGDETVTAHITFISPLAIEIDGVAYFEATLAIDNPPEWIRGGLNADIDIIVDTKENVMRLPKRFLVEEGGAYSVVVPKGDTTATTAVGVGFVGNDGYVEVTGLNIGDTVIAP